MGGRQVDLASRTTERKKVIEKLKGHKNHLEAPVEERTSELTQLNQKLQYEIAERKLAEKKLRCEKDFTESLINTLQAIVLVLDTEGNIVRFNPYMEEISGFRLEEVKGKDWFTTFLPERDKKRTRNIFSIAVRNIQTNGNINHIVTKGGGEREIKWHYETFKEDGNVPGLLAIGDDITDRLYTEEKLLKTQLIMQEAERTAHLGSWSWNLKSGEVQWSEEMYRIYGIDKNKFDGKIESAVSGAIHPDDIEKVRKSNERVLKEKISLPLEYRVLRPDGTERTVWSEGGKFIADDTGEAIELIGSLQDVTGHKQAEKALLEEKEKYRTLFDNAGDAILIHDFHGKILEANRTMSERTGYKREKLRQMSLKHIISFSDDVPAGEHIKKLKETDRASFQAEEVAKNGSTIPVEITAVAFDYRGRPAVLSISRDISSRIRLESQLHQTQKMEAIGRLAGGIAHDFNNVLTAILGYADLIMLEPVLDDGVVKKVMEIRKAGKRASDLTRQLLLFSRKQVTEPKNLNIDLLIKNLCGMLHRLIGEDVKLIAKLEAHTGTILADHGRMEQVVMNLVINARDAMPGGGKLTVETKKCYLDESFCTQHHGMKSGRYVMLAVSDTGLGMDEETRKHIFEPFFTTKTAGKGTGLGLSTVYGIVKQCGGFIWVYSEPGLGTTFKIYLPEAIGDNEKPPSGVIQNRI